MKEQLKGFQNFKFNRSPTVTPLIKSAYDTKFFIGLFERAFKMMKNGVYFISIALLVAELFQVLIYAN